MKRPHRPSTGRGSRRTLTSISAVAVVLAITLVTTACLAPTDPALRRYPYLTDLVGNSVVVNWMTDRSQTQASVKWGAVQTDGSCTPSTTVAATRTAITVNSVATYQWMAQVTFPQPGTYCYRVYLGSTDLLQSNASPTVTTQVPAGSSEPFSFAVFGDWGATDANGNNPGQAGVISQIGKSGVRFAVGNGDTAYMSGNQNNYGDLQTTGADISDIFGSQYWAQAGATVPLFNTLGNHGLSLTGASLPFLVNWPEPQAVATSGGRYQTDVYCCVNGTTSQAMGSAWYAFDAGNARFYMLDAAWPDTNPGTADGYANDYAAHWTPGSTEYEWLANDLATHPTQLKFAFMHYPPYSDQKSEHQDPYLQGPNSLEGLLARNGVDLAFSGHSHIYERNTPAYPGGLVTYVSGGGGGTLEPIGEVGCSPWDAYGIGWSPTKLKGSACGEAPAPTADSQVFHWLKVTVNGMQVTVAPTDANGNTFDVQTYDFSQGPPDTGIDSGPPALTNQTEATFAFHATEPDPSFFCSLDGAEAAPCTSPYVTPALGDGAHTFSVVASTATGTDATPATASWTVDTTPPTVPDGLAASAPSAAEVQLSWQPATDSNGVAGYDIARDGTVIATNVQGTSYADGTTSGSTSYQYSVRAVDEAGNASAWSDPVAISTPPPVSPVFQNGFETGDLTGWASSSGLVVQSSTVHSGSYAALAQTTTGTTYAKANLPTPQADLWSRLWVNVQSLGDTPWLLAHRTATGDQIGYVYLTPTGQVAFRNSITGAPTVSNTTIAAGGGWHAVELHTLVNGPSSTVEVWLDGAPIPGLSITTDLGAVPVGQIQIGGVQASGTYSLVFDDVAASPVRVGLG